MPFEIEGKAMIRATVLRALLLTVAFAAALTPVTCLGQDSKQLPTKRSKEVAGQGNKEATARAALAAPAKEDAHQLIDPRARFQGRGGARSLETGHHRPFPDSQDLSDLSLVGRSWTEVLGGRRSDSGGVLQRYARADESSLQLLSRNQHRLPEQLRQGEHPRRQPGHDPWRLPVGRLLRNDRRTDRRNLFAGARHVPGRPSRHSKSSPIRST